MEVLNYVLLLSILNTALLLWMILRPEDHEEMDQPRGPEPGRRNLLPFGKPNGKKKPRVNDEAAAWAKENERV